MQFLFFTKIVLLIGYRERERGKYLKCVGDEKEILLSFRFNLNLNSFFFFFLSLSISSVSSRPVLLPTYPLILQRQTVGRCEQQQAVEDGKPYFAASLTAPIKK